MSTPRASLRLSILTGVALAALGVQAARAQDGGDKILFSADEVTRTPDGAITAKGDVEFVNQGRVLKADEATSDPQADVISAQGDVRLYQPDGSAEFADSLIFTQSLETGVATNFSARLPQNATIAAANVIRRDENTTEMNRGIFTTCPLCDAQGDDIVPTWSVSADKVVRDVDNQSINYRNAVIRIKGVPVLYTPFFSHADPTADRKSGLLAPDFEHTRRRGLSWEQPYLWSISPYQDLVVSPQINSEVNPFINLDWRRRFYSGFVEAEAGWTYERDFNSVGTKFGDTRSKGYILAAGEFEPNDDWRWGFTAEGAEDRRVFDQYGISLYRPDRGLFAADDRRLLSQIYAVRQNDRSYFSISAFGFQSLRPLLGPPNAFGVQPLEDNGILPVVGPLVEFRYEPLSQIAGGRLRLIGSGVLLTREDSPYVSGAPGADSARGSFEADWRRMFTFSSGVRFEPFLYGRGDVYRTHDVSAIDTSVHSVGRAIATAGANLSWPLVRVDGPVVTTVEPIIQIALSPDTKISPYVPDEDSLAFEFDDSNLFDIQRFPGFDLYEGGQRINVGVRTTVDWGQGRNARFIVGQSFRAKDDPVFPARTGLDQRTSDWVFGGEVTPIQGLSFFTHARFNGLDLKRIESGVDGKFNRLSGYLRYRRTDADFSGLPREDIEGAGQLFFTDHWGIIADAIKDLEQDTWRQRTIGAVYQDDCLRFELLYQRDNNPVLGQRESSSILVRLTLATLGDTGYSSVENRRSRAYR